MSERARARKWNTSTSLDTWHGSDGPFLGEDNSHTLHIMNSPSTHCQFKAANSRVQLQVKTTLVGMARSLNSDARKQPNPPPDIGLGLTANLPRDKTALQRVLYTELDQSPSHLIFKKH